MDTTWDGKKVKEIWWNGENGDEVLKSNDYIQLELDATYHGDRDEFWIKHLENGKEIARHNCKYISSIRWL